MDITIETLQRRGQLLWRVRAGPRGVTFHEELAARAFAAQLHQRLLWLSSLADSESGDKPPH